MALRISKVAVLVMDFIVLAHIGFLFVLRFEEIYHLICPRAAPLRSAAALSPFYHPVKVVPARPGRGRSTALDTP